MDSVHGVCVLDCYQIVLGHIVHEPSAMQLQSPGEAGPFGRVEHPLGEANGSDFVFVTRAGAIVRHRGASTGPAHKWIRNERAFGRGRCAHDLEEVDVGKMGARRFRLTQTEMRDVRFLGAALAALELDYRVENEVVKVTVGNAEVTVDLE